MRLYLVSRTDKIFYDEYDAFVVCAADNAEAMMTRPDNKTWEEAKTENYPCWVDDPMTLEVRYLGEADDTVELGIVLDSFNAG
jgi:hypothetical protein